MPPTARAAVAEPAPPAVDLPAHPAEPVNGKPTPAARRDKVHAVLIAAQDRQDVERAAALDWIDRAERTLEAARAHLAELDTARATVAEALDDLDAITTTTPEA